MAYLFLILSRRLRDSHLQSVHLLPLVVGPGSDDLQQRISDDFGVIPQLLGQLSSQGLLDRFLDILSLQKFQYRHALVPNTHLMISYV